jgi:hypothetical protein
MHHWMRNTRHILQVGRSVSLSIGRAVKVESLMGSLPMGVIEEAVQMGMFMFMLMFMLWTMTLFRVRILKKRA